MKTTHLITTICAAAILATTAFAQGDDVRAKLKELEQRAREAKEAGRGDEANAIMEKAKRIQVELRERGANDGDKMEMAKRKVEELRKDGKGEEADQLERRIRDAGEKRRDGDKPRDKERGGDERQMHIAEAIKHLHAAGLHEPAERIAQIGREQAQRRPREEGKPGVPREAAEQMQRAVKEMQEQTQRALRETHEQMAKMARTIDELREQVAKQSAK